MKYVATYWGPCDDAEAQLETVRFEASPEEDAFAKAAALSGVDRSMVYSVRQDK